MTEAAKRRKVDAAASATPKQGSMVYNTLGSSDLRVSEVCLGTMTFGQQNSEEESHAILDAAFEAGVNFIDTAEMYPVPPCKETAGASERIVGTWLKTKTRGDVIIATKVAGYSGPTERGYVTATRTDPPGKITTARLSKEQIHAAVKGSLRRLQTDYIDVMQLHWPDRYVPVFGANRYNPENERETIPIAETVAALGELLKSGQIRHWGLSNESTFGVCKFMACCKEQGVAPPVSIQNGYGLVWRTFECELAEACAPSNFNIGLLPWSVLGGGILTGKYALEGEELKGPAEGRLIKYPSFQGRFKFPRVVAAATEYAAIAKKAGMTPTQLALLWCKSRWFIPSTIIGATSLQQLKENLSAFALTLSPELEAQIQAVHLQRRNPILMD